MAVVVGISQRRSTTGASSSSSAAVEIWLDDPSLHLMGGQDHQDENSTTSTSSSKMQCVLVLYGDRIVHSILTEKTLRAGDICYFPNLLVRYRFFKNHQPRKIPTVIYEFRKRPAWVNTQTEQDWIKLVRSNYGISEYCRGNDLSTRMTKPQQSYLQELVQWYRQQNEEPRQPPETKQRKSLEEMVASLGVMSSVLVSVVAMEIMNPSTTTATPSPRKGSAKRQRPNPTGRHLMATVSDCHHTMVLFWISSSTIANTKELQTTLQQALDTRTSVWLYNVVCQRGKDVPATSTGMNDDRRYWDEEVVLVPTSKTHLVLCPNHGNSNKTKNMDGGGDHCQTQPFLTHDTQQSQPLFSQPQPSATSASATLDNPTNQDNIRVVETTLRAIIFSQPDTKDAGGEASSSLSSRTIKMTGKTRPWKSLKDLMHLLIHKDTTATKGGTNKTYTYRSATLILDHWGNNATCSSNDKGISVYADSDGIQQLCGVGLDAKELATNPRLQAPVGEWLWGILSEKELLRWRLLPRPCNGTANIPSGDHEYLLQKVTLVAKL